MVAWSVPVSCHGHGVAVITELAVDLSLGLVVDCGYGDVDVLYVIVVVEDLLAADHVGVVVAAFVEVLEATVDEVLLLAEELGMPGLRVCG